MFVRLTRQVRRRAGWSLVFAYLFCFLAPTISFAAADGSLLASCLTDETHIFGTAHTHIKRVSAQHVHDGPGHQSIYHADIAPPASGDTGHNLVNVDNAVAPAKVPHKSSDGQCCSLACVSALPASLMEFNKPAAPQSVCDDDNYRYRAAKAPPALYRPPIS